MATKAIARFPARAREIPLKWIRREGDISTSHTVVINYGVATFQHLPATTVAVLLAAGAGSRFTGTTHKLHSTLQGRSVLSHAVSSAVAAGFSHIFVVWGAIEPPHDLASPPEVILIRNPQWETGQASSLQVGITAARNVGATAIVVGLGDQPFVRPADWVAVASSRSPLAQALYVQADGQKTPGNPVRLAAEVWPLLPTDGDFGARNLISSRPELLEQVLCTGSPFDIDTIEDLNQWN